MNHKEHTNYFSRYAIKEIVNLDFKFPDDLKVFIAKIRAVKFEEDKVYYDVYVEFENGGYTILKDLDSIFISDLEKPPHRPERA